MLANTKTILEKAARKNYAVGHFNINNMEILQGVVQAANNLKAPIIVATSEGAIKYAGMNFLYDLVRTASELSKVPIALHLDHGQDMNIIRQAIKIGYSSVMFDGSHYPFKKNLRLTKKVVKLAHKKNISVEAELGTIGGVEDNIKSKKIIYTDPEKAQEFVNKTGCDFLAIAIGTSHGAYKFRGPAKLNFALLKEIKQKIKVPLVLHGGSEVPREVVQQAEKYGAKLSGVRGVPDQQIRMAVKYGINKINTDTDLRIAFDAAVRKIIKTKPKDFDPRHILAPARDLITKVAEHRIKVFGSVKKW
ncbi:MAG: class II fructose-1,6-bisphosphate aldolase [Nanoarchaeota archaeon]|nr:class II fructose-1,6-bisphosphate aldolase [Nanoarchaeota archaeon]MBU1622931.1 class II fructose-1,6-bisphosphate aldolase [Nanoarchaeota archaeon]MBU1973944.1 class II fructose-1,6-bisphosphate aldolase [Nanoarchaeota archaeon]